MSGGQQNQQPRQTQQPQTQQPGSIIEEVIAIAFGDRLVSYGHPLDTYSRAAERISQRTGRAITWREVILDMIDIKLSRELHSHKRDNLVDVVGYVWCYDQCELEEAKRIQKKS